MEWKGLEGKLGHLRLNPLHSTPILFYPNKPSEFEQKLYVVICVL
jgi:hypothetical protein